ncbi:hypothetical protein M407DRAFT_22296 [Tulasnella calospora MUT 4182]|uniref:Uncharacterized protein n=1 Tax=Tulasnella calospora MUT 4182 TaxID=1051891 RepID=A0A0C3L410_9AGAM|nr:hypothetical protein M407DRAFT_22296 [Tulasnella calospora MUT 4182]
MSHLLDMLRSSPSTSSSRDIDLGLTQHGEDMEIDWDAILFSPPHSPVAGTSPLSLHSSCGCSSNRLSDPEVFVLGGSLAESSSSLTSPLVKLRPLHLSCRTCGSSVVSPPSSPVARYFLEIHMGPSTRSKKQSALPVNAAPPVDAPPVDAPPVDAPPVDAPPANAKAKAKAKPAPGRGRKRKLPSVDDSDTEAPTAAPASAPVPAPAPASVPASAALPALSPRPAPATASAPVPPRPAARTAPKGKSKTTAPAQTAAGGAPNPHRAAEAAIQPSTAAALASTSGPLPSIQAAEDANHGTEFPNTVEELQQELRKLKKFKLIWLKEQQTRNAPPVPSGESSSSSPLAPDDSIARPPGERGKNGWNMQTMLLLEHDGDAYNALLATTRNAVAASGLDWRKKFDEQDPGRLAVCYAQMKNEHPHLKQFKNDWACRELTLGALQNRRKTEHSKIKGLMTAKKTDRPQSKRKGFKPRPRATMAELEQAAGSGDEAENGVEI